MAYKLIAFCALATAVSAGLVQHYEHHQPTHYVAAPTIVKHVEPVHVLKHVEYEAPAKYDFSYGVHDSHTGDVKSQSEVSDGHNVQGSYSLIDPDGFKRTVKYTADDHHGFNAVVHREPIGHKVVAAPVHHYEPKYTHVVAAPAHHEAAIHLSPAHSEYSHSYHH